MQVLLSKIDSAHLASSNMEQTVHEINSLKNEFEHLTTMVDEKERVAQKLEAEVAQWDPLSKLARRDIEIKFIHGMCN